jgi:hypothetical protein
LPEEEQGAREPMNVQKISSHWSLARLTTAAFDVRPLDKYLVSVKQHPKYRDLICYVFEFCVVTIKESEISAARLELGHRLQNPGPANKWLDLSELRRVGVSWSVNGDVIRAIHELFTHDLGPLPVFLPQ